MDTKYQDLAQKAVAMLADFDETERELKFKVARLIQGYVQYIGAPPELVKLVPADASGQVAGDVVALSGEAPLKQRVGGLWWVGMLIEYRHSQNAMLCLTETIPLGFSALENKAATFKVYTPDGEFEIREEGHVTALFEHIYRGTEHRLEDLLAGGKRPIGFL